jgi:hypothetical protein
MTEKNDNKNLKNLDVSTPSYFLKSAKNKIKSNMKINFKYQFQQNIDIYFSFFLIFLKKAIKLDILSSRLDIQFEL